MSLLPFLKNKQNKDASVIVQTRAPDSVEESNDNDGLEAAAQDILRAIADNDHKHLALAIQAAFDICDSRPHVEGPHLNEEEV